METTSLFSNDNFSPNTSIFKANAHMYGTRELCLFDLNKIKDVLEYFVDDEDVGDKLKTESLSLLNALKRVIGVL